VITALGQFLLSRMTLASDASDAVIALMLQGLGMSIVIIILSTLSLSRIPRAELGDAAGLAALLRQVGISTGLAMMATLLARSTPVGAALATDHAAMTGAVLQARVVAFQHTFTIGAVLYLCLLPLVWFIRAPDRSAS
jgi:DHA2 family multidrug resistance protein